MKQFISAVIVLVAAGSAAAAPLYEVDLEVSATSGGVFDAGTPPTMSNTSKVVLWDIASAWGATGFGAGASGPGSVAVLGTASYSVTDPTNDTCAQGIGTAISTIDDLIVWGSGVVNGLYLDMDLSGSMRLLDMGTTDGATTSLSLSFILDGGNTSIAGYRTIQEPYFFYADGVLGGVWPASQEAFDSTISIGPFDGVVTGAGNPHTLRIAMSVTSNTCRYPTSFIGDEMNASGNLGSTLSFTLSGPAFTSDDENFIAASSVEGDIDLNGMWTGTPVSVPEPTPSVLRLAALITLAGLYRLRAPIR